MGKNTHHPLRVFTDASFYASKRRPNRASGAVVVVGPDGALERAFLINYAKMNLQSCSIAETLTMTVALEKFKGRAVSLTGDSSGDVERLVKFFTSREAFNRSASNTTTPHFIRRRLAALEPLPEGAEFHHDSRKNPYIRIADQLAERAHEARPGILHEVPIVNGQPCRATLDRIAPLPPEAQGGSWPSPYGG